MKVLSFVRDVQNFEMTPNKVLDKKKKKKKAANWVGVGEFKIEMHIRPSGDRT